MLKNIKIVLVRPFHPGNIGSAARAMKTMGISSLCLVNPKNHPNEEALTMARSASDVVSQCVIVDSVYQAVKDCDVVVASTARPRGYDLPELTPEQCAQQLKSHAALGEVALLFGPERMGLSNDDLQYAHYRVTIPTSPDYPSLNMAAAVQTLCYEVFKGYQDNCIHKQVENTSRSASIETMERLYVHLEETLSDTGFIFKKHPGEIMKRIRTMIARSTLTASEVSIFRGVLTSIQKSRKESDS